MRLAIALLMFLSVAHAGDGSSLSAALSGPLAVPLAGNLAGEIEDVAARPLTIAEPMVFDLVCELGAKRGTAEVNALMIVPLDSDDPSVWEIAPELEYAVADGFALELELPFEDGDLESIKFAAQYTIGRCGSSAGGGSFIHGVQVITERLLHDDAWDLALLYIPAYRFNDTWSTISLLGIGAFVGSDTDDELAALINTTLLADITDELVIGFEVNLAWVPSGATSMLLMPQIHVDLSERVQLQFGVGVLYLEGDGKTGIPSPGSPIDGGLNVVPRGSGWYPQAALRLIYNF